MYFCYHGNMLGSIPFLLFLKVSSDYLIQSKWSLILSLFGSKNWDNCASGNVAMVTKGLHFSALLILFHKFTKFHLILMSDVLMVFGFDIEYVQVLLVTSQISLKSHRTSNFLGAFFSQDLWDFKRSYLWKRNRHLPKGDTFLSDFPKSKTKNTLKNTIHFPKVKHDMIIMETHDYWSTWWTKLDPKNTVENYETFWTSFHLTTQKIQQLWPVPKKIQILEIQNPKKYSDDSCL